MEIAVRKPYEQDETPSIARKTAMKRLLKMVVNHVHFKCNETGYVRKMVWQWWHLLPLF